MNFQDLGIIIAKRSLKENSSIITVFTKNHGLYSGLLREPKRNKGSVYQPGNYIDFFWQARLHEHLGYAKCELIKAYNAVILTDKLKLYAFNSLTCLIKVAFHEREPHNNFFDVLFNYLASLVDNDFSFKNYVDLELAILEEAGYHLDLTSCALTGSYNDLKYVSPKSGKAVSVSAGKPYIGKLLLLPQFMTQSYSGNISSEEVKQAFELITYFFHKSFDIKDSDIEPRRTFFSCIQKIT